MGRLAHRPWSDMEHEMRYADAVTNGMIPGYGLLPPQGRAKLGEMKEEDTGNG